MKIKLVAIGTRMPAWVTEGVNEYTRRMPREMLVDMVEVPMRRRGKNDNVQRLREQESEALVKATNDCRRRIALDVKGRPLSTEGLAEKMADWQLNGGDTALLVGGPDGIDSALLKDCDERWSLSAMTLPHPLVRVLLAEQLYRAWSINANHPYHRS